MGVRCGAAAGRGRYRGLRDHDGDAGGPALGGGHAVIAHLAAAAPGAHAVLVAPIMAQDGAGKVYGETQILVFHAVDHLGKRVILRFKAESALTLTGGRKSDFCAVKEYRFGGRGQSNTLVKLVTKRTAEAGVRIGERYGEILGLVGPVHRDGVRPVKVDDSIDCMRVPFGQGASAAKQQQKRQEKEKRFFLHGCNPPFCLQNPRPRLSARAVKRIRERLRLQCNTERRICQENNSKIFPDALFLGNPGLPGSLVRPQGGLVAIADDGGAQEAGVLLKAF